MKVESKSKEARLDFFKSLFESAERASQEIFSDLDKYMRQYKGDTGIDGSQEAALTVRNITYEIVESQVSSDIPMPKADASSYSERRSRNAESIERLCRSVRNRLPFEEMNDIDERYTYIYGGSVWYVEWDNSSEYMGEVGGVKIHCMSPKNFIPQPGIYSIDDMEYCFLRFSTTRGELGRSYNIHDTELDKAETSFEFDTGAPEGDTVSVTVCFYKDEEGDVARFIFSGELTLSDIEKYYYRKGKVCERCKRSEGDCECESSRLVDGELLYETLYKDILSLAGSDLPRLTPKVENGRLMVENGAVVVERTQLPYYVPKRFPIVIRKNTSGEDSLLGQSDCDYIRPQQQAINKIESRILQKLLRAGITPIVPEDATVSINNSVFGQVIKMKPGESVAQYGKVDTTPNIGQDIAEAERLYDHAKRVVGVSDAFQGVDTGVAESGYAKQLRINQASGRLLSKKKMKENAYASIDRIIFTLYLAFADEPRRLSYKDAYGRIHSAEFNRYDFIEYDPKRGCYYYDDSYLFSVDRNEGADYERQTLWQRNLENLKAGTLGNPESPVTLLRYWQCQERAHYPYARENVEYFTKEVEHMQGGVTVELQ